MRAIAEMPSILSAVALMFILFAGLAGAAITINPGGSIQNAIDSANPGETIVVQSGTYEESLILDKSLILKGIDSGSGLPLVLSESGPAIKLTASGIILEGFEAESASGWMGDAAILILSNDNIIRNNTASGNGNAGIMLQRGINNTISGNTVDGNSNEGIYLKNSSRNLLQENRVTENGYGLKLEDSHTNKITGNIFQDNRFEAIHLQSSHSNLIEGNVALDNEKGLVIEKSRSNLVRKNDFAGNEEGISLSTRQSSKGLEGIESRGKGVYISYNSTPTGELVESNNSIYLNNLSNGENARDDGINYWDNGVIGNNYSDFNDPDEGCSGKKVCDSAHPIPGGPSVDEYPQASPVRVPGKTTGQGGTSMQLPGTGFPPGSEMRLSYTAPEKTDAWVGIKSRSLAEDNLSQDSYLGLNTSGELSLRAPDEEGSYQLVMHDVNATSIISLSFNVSTPKISAAPSSVFTCEGITVSFQGARGQEKDWIGMYKADTQDLVSSQSLGKREAGDVTFSAEEAGSYTFKLFASGESEPLGSSNSVEVKANFGHKVVAEPSKVSPGGSVTVTYWGAAPASVIGMYGITKPDKFDSGKRSTGGKSCGSMVWQLPAAPGNYDFRMFGDDVNRPILAYSNAVTVA